MKSGPLGTKPVVKACGDNDETQPELVTTMPTPPTAPGKKVQSFEDANERRSQYQNVTLINLHGKNGKTRLDATSASPVAPDPVEPTPPEPKPVTESENPPKEDSRKKEVRVSQKKKYNKSLMGNMG